MNIPGKLNIHIPSSGRIQKCKKCGRRYFFYKKDKGTLKEEYCSKCARELK